MSHNALQSDKNYTFINVGLKEILSLHVALVTSLVLLI